MSCRFEHWRDYKRVLCVRPDNIGDVLMTTPAIAALGAAAERREITLLTSRAGATIARHVPEVDHLDVFDPPWYRHQQAHGRDALQDVVARLAAGNFDAAVIFTVFSQNPLPTAMLCYMAGIPRVAGYCRENPYELIHDWVPDTEPLYGVRHEVQRQLDLVELLGAKVDQQRMSLQVPGGQTSRVKQVLESAGINVAAPWLLLHPGASEARRRYSAASFAAAARAIRNQLDVQVVLTGSTAEVALAESIAHESGDGVTSIAGQLDMDGFIALVAMAPLLISNNTGPVHIAAALQTPVVVLYALTNPQHAPWQVPHRVLPFDVPADARTRNVLVRYAGERFFPGQAAPVTTDHIVTAARELLEATDGAQLAPTELVTTITEPRSRRHSAYRA